MTWSGMPWPTVKMLEIISLRRCFSIALWRQICSLGWRKDTPHRSIDLASKTRHEKEMLNEFGKKSWALEIKECVSPPPLADDLLPAHLSFQLDHAHPHNSLIRSQSLYDHSWADSS